MTTASDLPLPSDWSQRRLLGTAALGWCCWLLVGLRHAFVTGEPVVWLFDAGEGLGLLLATCLGGLAFARALRQASTYEPSFLWRGALLLTALATLVPAFLSSDAWDYVARGRVSVLGHNCYTTTVQQVASDPAIAAFAGRSQWDGWPMPYGPVSAALQWLVGHCDAPWAAVYLWKLLMAGSHLLASWLLLLTLRTLGAERDARLGFVAWAWNPFVLLECCSSGHNDALLVLGLSAMVYGVARNRWCLAAVGYGGSILAKHAAAPLAPLLLAQALWQRRWRAFAVGTAIVAAVTAASYWRWWSGDGGLDWISRQNDVARGSVVSLTGKLLGPAAGQCVQWLGGLATAAVLLLGLRRARDAQSLGRIGALLMVVFVVFFAPNFAPWYHLWWLPLFALGNAPVLTRVLELLAWAGPLYYLVFASTHAFGLLHETWGLLVAGLWPALLMLLEWRSLFGFARKTVAIADGADDHQH